MNCGTSVFLVLEGKQVQQQQYTNMHGESHRAVQYQGDFARLTIPPWIYSV